MNAADRIADEAALEDALRRVVGITDRGQAGRALEALRALEAAHDEAALLLEILDE